VFSPLPCFKARALGAVLYMLNLSVAIATCDESHIIMWHVDLLLSIDLEINNHITD
jgi:hypothetical protein